jgi:hypothetical protein
MAARLAGNALTAGIAAHYLETAAELAQQSGPGYGLFRLPASAWEEKAARLLAPCGDVEETAPRPHPPQATDPLNVPAFARTPAPAVPGVTTKFAREAGDRFSSQANYIVNERIKALQVGPDAVRNLGPSPRLWLQICGDVDVREYTPRTYGRICSVLIDILKFYWRPKAEQEKHIL